MRPGLILSMKSIIFYLIVIVFSYSCSNDYPRVAKLSTGENVENITSNSAKIKGTIEDIGEGIDLYGHCWSELTPVYSSASTSFTEASPNKTFTSTVTGLKPDTRYYIRAYAITSDDPIYGEIISFITLKQSVNSNPELPTVVTVSVSNVTDSTAEIEATVTDDGNAEVTIRGICWNTKPSPTVNDYRQLSGSGTGNFTCQITDLNAETDYYVRAYATNEIGTGYGNEIFFTNKTSGTFTDSRDGNTYNWIRIGNQVWMIENMAYLTSVSPSSEVSEINPYYYVYDYQGTSVSDAMATNNYQTYGVLYNWPAAMESCPSGWHLPSDNEWKELEMYLGMSQSEADNTDTRGTDEGGKLKETGMNHWEDPNLGATNESGFTALPGAHCSSGSFSGIGYYADFWTSTEENSEKAWLRALNNELSDIYRTNYLKKAGRSVRCVKDE